MGREIQLLPAEGQPFHEPDELLRRLRAEFVFVETSHDLGVERLQGQIDALERFNPIVFELAGAPKGSGPQVKAARLLRLRSALPDAFHVRFGDDPEHAHAQLLHPSEGFLFVVEDEEPWLAQIAERCARTMGYVLHDI